VSKKKPLPEQVALWWGRALRSLRSAGRVLPDDPECAASRAYYAAFYAVVALFAFENKFFKKHTGVEAAVHRELVHTKLWPAELGKVYSELAALRLAGDYGAVVSVTVKRARRAIREARQILEAVREVSPQPLPKRLPRKR
jgi:uncharacterized protein (UPF0332 family)